LGRLKPLSFREVKRRLESAGFIEATQKGSQVKFARRSGEIIDTAVEPKQREIPVGTLRGILNQARIHSDELDALPGLELREDLLVGDAFRWTRPRGVDSCQHLRLDRRLVVSDVETEIPLGRPDLQGGQPIDQIVEHLFVLHTRRQPRSPHRRD